MSREAERARFTCSWSDGTVSFDADAVVTLGSVYSATEIPEEKGRLLLQGGTLVPYEEAEPALETATARGGHKGQK